ncbi:hypothetical protein LWI29_009655 [Acer saccharum]|uniref:Reverse transcriptase zinc-binding domain-containing protein n=1 Tax=Acer saccharum TaxID=4024 RepID=A0AA39SM32_ACESA|nr:hypothetical protein LWI29_009655 [Acer saccharum]
MMSKFWWGSRKGKRKISWLKWQDLCLPKSNGGLGFKDLSLFNQALIAKQAWRILVNPSSLAARILKAKYFQTEDFLQVSIKSGCSHLWRSLIWGRSLLLKGLRWKVGDGRSINAFKDPWLPRPSTFKPITPDPNINLQVADLIDNEFPGWNINALNHHFLPIDREIILSIPVSYLGGPDSISWHFDKSGSYTVKSGYRLALSEKLNSSVSNSTITRKWWTSIWNQNVPPKVKVFVWRACLNAIPAGFNLWKRRILDQPFCSLCRSSVDVPGHSLFWCKEAKRVWGCSRFDSFFDGLQDLSVLDVLSRLFSRVSKEDFASICIISWAIWDNRNLSISGGKSREPEDLIRWAEAYLAEFQLAQRKQSPNGSGVVGIGVAIRNDKGKVLASLSKALRGNFNLVTCSALALREGLLLAKTFNLKIMIAEVESQLVASSLFSPTISGREANAIFKDINFLSSEVGICLGQTVSRSGNLLACNFASLASSSYRDSLWLDFSSAL